MGRNALRVERADGPTTSYRAGRPPTAFAPPRQHRRSRPRWGDSFGAEDGAPRLHDERPGEDEVSLKRPRPPRSRGWGCFARRCRGESTGAAPSRTAPASQGRRRSDPGRDGATKHLVEQRAGSIAAQEWSAKEGPTGPTVESLRGLIGPRGAHGHLIGPPPRSTTAHGWTALPSDVAPPGNISGQHLTGALQGSPSGQSFKAVEDRTRRPPSEGARRHTERW